MNGPRHRPVRAHLQRRLFLWFGAAILVTGITVNAVGWFLGGGGAGFFRRELEGARSFVASRFALVWDDGVARDELGASIARHFSAHVVLRDAGGRAIGEYGRPCDRPGVSVPVERGGSVVGTVTACLDRPRVAAGRRFGLALVVIGAVLWAISGVVARRLAGPFVELTRVAREIGAGRLSSRMRLPRGEHDEAGELAGAVNDMAARIERQMADQRELLAAVSHELRTPLGHVRLLAELLRDGASKPELLDQIDREVQEMDALVGELLAGARLEFSALTLSPVKPVDLVRQALERAGLAGAGLLADDAEAPTVLADPTLVGRAIANLLDNAARHGRGARQVRVVTRDHAVAFEVDDAGPGFPPGEEQRVFRPFYAPPGRPRDARSLGLGLALVERIAEAHGGRAWAENLPGGGARVGFEIAAG